VTEPSVPRDRGSLLPFTAVVVAALVACAGLALDGGKILAARREASAVAAAAARRGSQELAWRDAVGGRAGLDPARARAAAESYLAQAHVGGSAVATPDGVRVTAVVSAPTVVLHAFGVGPKAVTATRSATPFTGGGG
jgi:hypothetical protein